MSRYVKKKHGLLIGSGNNFFHWNTNGDMVDYPSILVFEGYHLDQPNTLNHTIKTPAIQMLWETRSLPAPTASLFDRQWVDYAHPNAWFEKWLDKECPGWGVALPRMDDPVLPDYTLFLAKRSHAVAISKMVDKNLAGLRLK